MPLGRLGRILQHVRRSLKVLVAALGVRRRDANTTGKDRLRPRPALPLMLVAITQTLPCIATARLLTARGPMLPHAM